MRSTSDNPKYINDEGCDVAAAIQVFPPTEGWPDEVEFQYTLSITRQGTRVDVRDLKTGKHHPADISESTYQLLDNSSTSLLKGALSFLIGTNPNCIIHRKACFTYGYWSDPLFSSTEHNDSYKQFWGAIPICRGVFVKVIEKGQLLKKGDIFASTIRNLYIPGDNKRLSLYRSSKENPKYILASGDCCVELRGLGKPSYALRKQARLRHLANWRCQLIVDDYEFVLRELLDESHDIWKKKPFDIYTLLVFREHTT